MRKLDVRNYTVQDLEGKAQPYKVKESIVLVLLASGPVTTHQLNMRELLDRAKIKDKIEKAKDFVLLEDAEFAQLKDAFESYRGYGPFEVELCKRVENAEAVDPNK